MNASAGQSTAANPTDDKPIDKWEERQNIREATRLSAKLVYEVIRRDGEEELGRPFSSLLWSGVAGGLMISFSVFSLAVFRLYLPDASWAPLVEHLGYSFGFLLVILGRLQLFTENTITTVIPLYKAFSWFQFYRVCRLWMIVFLANLLGGFIAAGFFYHSSLMSPELKDVVYQLSAHAMEADFGETFVRAIPAGILIAALVWILPTTSSVFLAIVAFTYLISLGGMAHVVAGSVEAFYLVHARAIMFHEALMFFILPALLGNIFGGTVIFSMMAWGQVKNEPIKNEPEIPENTDAEDRKET